MVCNCCGLRTQQCPTLSCEDGSQVLAAIEQRDRVQWIYLQDISSPLLEKMVKMMQETYPTLEHLRLWADDEIAPPSFPRSFLAVQPHVSKHFG